MFTFSVRSPLTDGDIGQKPWSRVENRFSPPYLARTTKTFKLANVIGMKLISWGLKLLRGKKIRLHKVVELNVYFNSVPGKFYTELQSNRKFILSETYYKYLRNAFYSRSDITRIIRSIAQLFNMLTKRKLKG